MASMNPGIILSGRAPDIMGSMARGAETGQFVNDARHTNAYRNALSEYGPGAFQGDPNAMNALAAYDPQGMLGMRTTMNAERRADSAEGRAAEAHRIRLAEYTSGLDAASAAAERERIVKGLSGAAFFYQRGDEQGYNAWLQQQGLDPAEYPMANFEPIAMGFVPVLEALEGVIERNAGPEPATPGLKEYEAARAQGFTGTFLEYKQALAEAGRASTTVNVGGEATMGTIPQGFAVVPDPASPTGTKMVAIPGGPEDTTKFDAERITGRDRAADIVLDDISRVMTALDQGVIPVTGLIGGTAANVPGTAAYDVAKTLDTIRANVGFDKLQQMRESSPTGGALGQVSEMENRLLQSVLGNLTQSQSEAQFRYNLTRLEDVYLDIIHGKGNWTKDADGKVSVQTTAPAGGTPADNDPLGIR